MEWFIVNMDFFSFVNSFMPSGLFYLTSLDRSISYIRGVLLVFIITRFSKIYLFDANGVYWSDIAFCGVSSESTFFANVPFMGRQTSP